VLLEPTSVVAKAWEHLEQIGHRAAWSPTRVLVTGAGPIGLLAALLGVQRGLDVRVLDRVTDGPKPKLVADLGASYHTDIHEVDADAEIILECTGASALVVDVMQRNAHKAVVCLTGVSARGRSCRSTLAGSIGASSWGTTWCSGRSTPTAGTTSRRRRRSPTPIRPGWTG
jgi:threonine dehydrogenase-like Zn-dependent dehydrogenase